MLRQTGRTVLMLTLVSLFAAPAVGNGEEKKPDSASARVARDALSQFDKHWKPYTNEPNLGDPRWKLKMETLVRLAQAGPAGFPVLEEAAKQNSPWAASTRELAEESLRLLRKDDLRKALADYDLAQMDSARVGKLAPDFALPDATGKTHRLSELREKKIVVLAFVIQDT